jgi:hypothetical protein
MNNYPEDIIKIRINQIIVTEFTIPPEQIQQLRTLITMELEKVLAQQELSGLSNRAIPHLSVSVPSSEQGDGFFTNRFAAQQLAQTIAQSLNGSSSPDHRNH